MGNLKGIPQNNTSRDVCLHLLAMVTLYWSAISFITLCWQYVNYFFPDALADRYSDLSGSIRFAVSSLIIVFPVFIWVSWFLNKIYSKELQVRESKIRKWLIYVTLFITALVMIIDLVYIINTFLDGEVTTRFILKACSMLIIVSIIFGFYLDDVRRASASQTATYVAWVAGVMAVVLVVGAFLIVGSPMEARQARFDQQRIMNLKDIQFRLVNYWRSKSRLPAKLSALNDPISDFTVPVDPQTHIAYEYVVNDPATLSFKLCAVFNRSSHVEAVSDSTSADLAAGNWNHAAGHVCFQRSIDKQLYPPYKTS